MSDTAPLPLDRWCASGPVRVSPDGSLQVVLRAADPVEVSLVATASDEAALVATWSAPMWLAAPTNPLLPALEDMAQATAAQGSALLDCVVVGAEVRIRLPLYLEGMSRHTFLEAACDLARAHIALASAAAALGERRDELDQVARTIAEADTAAAASTRSSSQPPPETATAASFGVHAGTFETSSASEAMPMPPATSVNEPTPMGPVAPVNEPASMPAGAKAYSPTASWEPSHLVPPEGLPAWETPDGRTAPATQLWGGLPVQVVEHWNGWARIVCSNEWTAWVDAARLQSRSGRA
jgi:hypothetical protein